jgi:hypothetical protein
VPGQKHYILYARQNLKDTRLLLGGIFIAYLGVGIGDVVTHGYAWARFVPWATYSTFPIFVFIALWLYGRFTYAVMDDDGIRVRFAYRKAVVPYTDIEKVRIDTIDRLFDRPDRSRMRTRAVKNLGEQRALCIRLRDGEDNLPAVMRRRLGPRMVLDRELVLPITEIDNAFAAVRSKVSSRRSVAANGNDGGGRRRRRKKGRR